MKVSSWSAVASAVLLSCLAPVAQTASLLAIDYGTDGFKVALIKPGVPFDVLINKDSKRKTPSMVTLRGDERSFGGEAANLATRFPKDTFQAVKLLLGHPASHPQSQLHQSLFQHPASTTARGSPSVTSSSASFPVEEILAMQFGYAKEMAEEVAKEGVRDVVVTVPGWFGISERQAVLDAVELAGLRSIGLVNDGTASAVNYAMTRTFPPTPSYHLIYDFGAGSLRTTLVSLKSALLPDPLSLAAKPELKNATTLEVHGIGYDTSIGGYVFDKLIRDILREDFEAQIGKPVGGDARAMAKLLREAGRVKHVLSANTASAARIEGLMDDVDFKTTVTREQLETRCAEIIPRFSQPIYDALALANLTVADIESVILVGGSSRVPMVESAVRAVVGEERIAKNVNADEAAVMGAALYGAGITRGFRTKDIRVHDVTPYGIDIAYESDPATADAEPTTVTLPLFSALSELGAKKTITFPKASDFAVHFSYAQAGTDQPADLFETTVKGITTALTNLTAEAIANASVQVTFSLNESNMVFVSKAIVILSEEDEAAPSLNDRLKGFLNFGGKKGSPEDPETLVGDLDDEEFEATKAKMDELLKSLPTNSTVKLSTSTVYLERVPMSPEEKTDARKRLREVKAAEMKKLAREEARNVLEAFIYKARDLISDPSFVEASIPSERKIIEEKTAASNEWLWDEADGASTKDFKAKKSDLEKLIKHVSTRIAEAAARPRAVESFQETLDSADAFILSARANDTAAEKAKAVPRFTPVELDNVSKSIKEATEWFAATMKKQSSLKPHQDPILKVVDVERKAKDIEVEVAKLRKKKVPRKPKVVTPRPPKSSSAPPSEETTIPTEEPVVEPVVEGEPEPVVEGEGEPVVGEGRPKDEL